MEIVSMIHAIVWLSVYTSGAGMSFSGPIIRLIAEAYRRVIRSSSPLLISFGLQITPPFAPPYGRPMTAHFHVIQHARARTSSGLTFQWYRIPPLNGPRASLNCTRYPVNTFRLPSSIFTGKFTVSSRFGVLNSSIRSGFRPRRFPTRSICFFAISNGFRSSLQDGSGASAGRAFRVVRGVGHVPQRPTVEPGLKVVDGRMEGDHPLW